MKYQQISKIIIIIFCISISRVVGAQESWIIPYGENVFNRQITFIEETNEFLSFFIENAYVGENGKLKKLSKQNPKFKFAQQYSISGPILYKKSQLMCMTSNNSEKLYFPILLSNQLLAHFVYTDSIEVARKKLNESYYYVCGDSWKATNIPPKWKNNIESCRYISILGKQYYRLSIREGYYTTNDLHNPILIYSSFDMGEPMWLGIKDINNIVPIVFTQFQIDSLLESEKKAIADEQRKKDAEQNKSLFYGISLNEKSIRSNIGETKISDHDTIVIYYYDNISNEYVGLYYGDTVYFQDYSITINQKDKQFLKRMQFNGMEERLQNAHIFDSTRVSQYPKRIEAILSQIDSALAIHEKFLTELVKKKIFLVHIDYSYSDYKFGLEFEFYNCFGKTIKYVEVTTTPYNNVDDVQRDDFGRTNLTMKGIGPIAPKESGSYDFNNLYWDDNDVIKYLRVTKVKFIFKDGTTQVFSGWDNIRKHYIELDKE